MLKLDLRKGSFLKGCWSNVGLSSFCYVLVGGVGTENSVSVKEFVMMAGGGGGNH